MILRRVSRLKLHVEKKIADLEIVKRSTQSMATASITSPTLVTSTSTATVARPPTTAASPVLLTRIAVPRWTLTVFASFSTRVLPAPGRTLSLDTTMAARLRMYRLGRVLLYQMGTAGRRLRMERISFRRALGVVTRFVPLAEM